jgi:hypothetical protein
MTDTHSGRTSADLPICRSAEPDFYRSMTAWSHAFDAPLYLHAADRAWVGRPDPAVHLWEGETHDLALRLSRIYAAFRGRVVDVDGPGALRRSADRYLRFAIDD